MFEIVFSKEANNYIIKKNLQNLLIKSSHFSQKCIQIYEPKIVPISHEESKKYQDYENRLINGLHVYFSNQFIENFKNQNDIHIDIKKFPKKLIIKNIDPIIINICKLDNNQLNK